MNNIAAVVKKRKGKLIREGKEKKLNSLNTILVVCLTHYFITVLPSRGTTNSFLFTLITSCRTLSMHLVNKM